MMLHAICDALLGAVGAGVTRLVVGDRVMGIVAGGGMASHLVVHEREAIAVLDPAIAAHKRRSPELAELHQRMAHLAAARGDRDNHLEWLKKAFDVDRKNAQIAALRAFQGKHVSATGDALHVLQQTALQGGNIFAAMMDAVRVASMGQITKALFRVGGEYRRNL